MEQLSELFIFSDTIKAFLHRVKEMIREIAQDEMKLKMRTRRLELAGRTYPIHLLCFERKQTLAYYDANTYTFGLNKKLLLVHPPVLKNILRHELAHFVCIHQYGDSGHTQLYRDYCSSLGWHEEVYSAKMQQLDLEQEAPGDLKSLGILEKVKKLLNLANRAGEYESKAACAKANELLIKYNLQKAFIQTNQFSAMPEEDEVVMQRVYQSSRMTAKMRAISNILELFFVRPILNYTKNQVYLEVVGGREHVDVASYIASFLDRELEQIWNFVKREAGLTQGQMAKQSFMQGIAQGYIDKINEERVQMFKQDAAGEKMLVSLENQLDRQVDFVYGRLKKLNLNSRLNRDFYDKGHVLGRKLSIHKGIEDMRKQKTYLIDL